MKFSDQIVRNSNAISLIKLIQDFFTKGHARTIAIKRNVLGSMVMRAMSMLLGFIQIPITLHYLGATNYGIWITIGSFIALMNFFDIGLGNGLKNNLAEAKAKNQDTLAQSYVSTTYFLITVIMMITYIVFLLVMPFINWSVLLNAEPEMSANINLVVLIVFTSFILNFILKIIRIVYVADQKPAFVDFTRLCGSILTLAAIIIVANFSSESLVLVALSFSVVPFLIYAVSSLVSYSTLYKKYTPSLKFSDLKHAKTLMSLGVKFFIIQIAGIILYSTDNIIISHILGPADVTPYSIAFKYFSAALVIYTLIATPYWSAFTDAYHKNDFDWIKNSIKKLKTIGIIIASFVLFMLVVSGIIYQLWIGSEVSIPFSLSFFMSLNIIIMILTTPYVQFINGVGMITLQLVVSVFNAIINIPLSILFAKNMNFGVTGVIMATCFANFIALILWPIQYKKLINNKAFGLWGK